MSAANVKFYKFDFLPCPEDQPPIRFGFRCPVRSRTSSPGHVPECSGLLITGTTDIKRGEGGAAQWDWDGNRESPTFKPSINCEHCKWHGFIENGRCVDQSRKDEP